MEKRHFASRKSRNLKFGQRRSEICPCGEKLHVQRSRFVLFGHSMSTSVWDLTRVNGECLRVLDIEGAGLGGGGRIRLGRRNVHHLELVG